MDGRRKSAEKLSPAARCWEKLLLLAMAMCGLETLRDGEEASFGVEARSETQSLLREESGFCCFDECTPASYRSEIRSVFGL